jgi:hypothetical protein
VQPLFNASTTFGIPDIPRCISCYCYQLKTSLRL